ncbi:hypothetical protein [Pseudonocardia sp. KRD291]|uniref:hypothetical protein n=1 Tax=Pseudonocardia sp. KRD291 TaxID=2792007 RepID=UPI001C49D78F|nr:hypothetical protein [Pseudonocardia sp. KRD291]MBW0103887.1 hypothetical protein [Pseudonocardia sp. KRD291]
MSTPAEVRTAGTRGTGDGSAAPPASGPGRPSPMTVLRGMAPSLLLDVALPYLLYLLLTGVGMSDVAALAWSALPVVLTVAVTAVRARCCSTWCVRPARPTVRACAC